MKKLKLLVYHSAIAPYRIDFFNALNEHFEAHFYFFRKNLINQRFDTKRILEQLSFQPNFLTKGFDFTRKKRLVRFGFLNKIFKHNPDIIICLEYSLITILILFFCRSFYRKTKIYTICDDSFTIANNCSGIRRIARSICMRMLHGIILTNNQVKEWYDLNFSSIKTIVFPIIQNEEIFIKKVNQSSIITAKYFNNYELSNKQIFLYVGRLAEVKNLEFLIDAFAEFSENKNNVVLIMVGDGSLKTKLVSFTNNLNCADKVLFPGRFENEELYAWYCLADYFILPSTYEPFGAVVNEALIAGVPVLCSDLAGASFLIHNNNNGFTFNPFNKKELLELLNNCLRIKKNKLNDILLSDSLMPFTFNNRLIKLLDFLNIQN